MEKVLIFGICGFVGKYLSEEFLSNGYQIIGSDCAKIVKWSDKIAFHQADLLNAGDTERIIEEQQPDIIINLAAISSVGQSWGIPQTTVSVNVIGALNIMEAARKLRKKPKIMFIGSSEEYMITSHPIDEKTQLDATNPYGVSKVAQEQFAKMYRDRYNLKIYCVRPFNHTGIGQRDSFVLPSFCKQVAEIVKSGKPDSIKVGNLTVQRDFSHVKDIVRAYRMIVESDDCNNIYNVGYGKAYKLEDMLQYVISLSNQKIDIQIDPEKFRPSDQPVICCDHGLITRKLGWEPEYTVYDALKEMYNYYLESDSKIKR